MTQILVLTGMPGAGKEEFVRVAQQRGYLILRMGDVVRGEAARRNIVMDDRGVGGFAHSERHTYGPGIWAQRCLPHLGEGNVIIDGSRSLTELEVFRAALGSKVRLIAIHTSPDRRFERLRERGRSDAPRDRRQFMERDERELGWGLGSLIAMADTMLVNEGPLIEFQVKVAQGLDGRW